MMLGLSRRNRHIELDGQLRLSRVPFHKNLAHSLSHNAPEQLMLAKLKIDTEAEEALALSTVRCPGSASFLSSSSFVGMILVVPPQMAPKLRQLALQESCDKSLPRDLAELDLRQLELERYRRQLDLTELELHKMDRPKLDLAQLESN